MLQSIELRGVGPVAELDAELGSRLNVVTGDNGLGKSFILDTCFWALTGTWPGGQDRPAGCQGQEPQCHNVLPDRGQVIAL